MAGASLFGAIENPHAGVVGIDCYGESAPAGALFPYFGFTVDHVAEAVRHVVDREPRGQ